jgi:allantoin racemase
MERRQPPAAFNINAPVMRQLLIVNPNTSAHVTALLLRHAQAAAGPGVRVRAVSARFGAPYIACEASYAVAGHALLDAWAAATADSQAPPDAVLIGCFGDPGLLALRETSQAPVTGLAEASFIEAARHGRFAVVTGGERWKPMLARLAQALGFAESLAGIHTVAPTGAQLAADPAGAILLLAQAAREAVRASGAQAVVIGGAGLAGLAGQLQPLVDAPLIDSVEAGVRQALAPSASVHGSANGRFDVAWQNLSPELAARGLSTS